MSMILEISDSKPLWQPKSTWGTVQDATIHRVTKFTTHWLRDRNFRLQSRASGEKRPALGPNGKQAMEAEIVSADCPRHKRSAHRAMEV